MVAKGCLTTEREVMLSESGVKEICKDTGEDVNYICKSDFCNLGSYSESCSGQKFTKSTAQTYKGENDDQDKKNRGRNAAQTIIGHTICWSLVNFFMLCYIFCGK